jgi:uncharacterized membrane protein YecN with MAPEG domain
MVNARVINPFLVNFSGIIFLLSKVLHACTTRQKKVSRQISRNLKIQNILSPKQQL